MEASITAFCPELSLGSNLEDKTELHLPKVVHTSWSYLNLFPDNELYRHLSRTQQEPKDPPQDLLVKSPEWESECNSCRKCILT